MSHRGEHTRIVQSLLLLMVCACAQNSGADDRHRDNLGQNFAQPLSRFDLRFKYQDMPGRYEATIMEARLDHPVDLAAGWKLNTRISLTGWVTDLQSGDNPGAAYTAGPGDLFTQLFFIAPAWGRTTIGFGGRNYFPTAGADQFGQGKYRFAPFVVVQQASTWMPAGSFYGLGLRHEFSFGPDGDRDDVNELQIVPVLTVVLPQQSFVTLFPEIIIDWEHHHGAFVPLDIEYGRKYASNRAASLRLQVPLMDDLQTYDWTLEARWSLFF